MSLSNRDLLKFAYDEIIEKGNVELLGETFSSEYVAHAGAKEYRGQAFLKRFVNQIRTAIPDLRIVELKFLADDGNNLVTQRTLEGTNEADMQGIPASGKKVKWVEMVVTRFEDQKIAEEWVVSELMGELLLRAPRA